MNILVGFGYHTGTTGVYLERSLARRHQVTYVGTPWQTRAGFAPNLDLAEFIAGLPVHPDLFIYIDSGAMPGGVSYFPRGLDALDLPTACYLIDVYPPATGLPNSMRLAMSEFFDYVFLAQRGCLDLYAARRDRASVHWLPLACDPEIHHDLGLERIYDVGFVGNIARGYKERAALLELLSRRYHLNDYRRPYFGEEMARVYSQSQIVINPIIGGILNMRVFEASACGALLLTERVDNGQNDLFKENEHFVSFKGRDEALAQIERYLADSAARQKVAAAGKAWTIAHHTYDHRATEMLDAIFGRGAPQKSAPIRALPQDKVRLAYARIYSMMRLLDATMREFAALRRLRRGRIAGLRQVLYALLRLSRAG